MLLRRTGIYQAFIHSIQAGTEGQQVLEAYRNGGKFARVTALHVALGTALHVALGTALHVALVIYRCAGGEKHMFLDAFKKNVINQIVAIDDGRALHSPLEPYFRAFTGGFSADMPFTFYFEATNSPVLLVRDPTPIAARSSHAVFVDRCEKIKADVMAIADFVQELVDGGYLAAQPLDFGDRPRLPPDYENTYRRYKHFYTDIMDSLFLVCFYRLKPQQKLYDVWLKFNPNALAS
jgi:hypothetical protein